MQSTPNDALYDIETVKSLLRNYFYILSHLDGSSARTTNDSPPTKKAEMAERPLGYANGDSPWPFMTKPRATQTVDGKQKARMSEDLHVSVLDLEEALQQLEPDDRKAVAAYYILGYTLDETCELLGVVSKGSMHKRLRTALNRLVGLMS